MASQRLARRMRGLLSILLLVLLAGCTSNAVTRLAPQATDARPATAAPPTHVAGTLWLPDQAAEPIRTELAFAVNATGANVTAKLHLGSRYVVDLPSTTAEVSVTLLAPGNVTLAKTELHSGAMDATLHATSNATGTHKLVLLSYGGSDGNSMGDHLDYVLDATGGR